mmetsp:Transcript_64501/g.154031  ORF Transcript_64501/g.154031 Transcript_64501/m.154031 type:complete len:713 (+) Transcript_64501:172-2310(+)
MAKCLSAVFILTAALVPQGWARKSESSGADSDRRLVTVSSVGEVSSYAREVVQNAESRMPSRVQPIKGSTPSGFVALGTPPRRVKVIFDTGSAKLLVKSWSTVQHILHEYDPGLSGAVQATEQLYDHNASSTFRPLYKTGCSGQQVQRAGMIHYGSGTAMTTEGNETLLVDGMQLTDFAFSEITADSLRVLHKRTAIAGVMGLQHMKNSSSGGGANSRESVFSRLRKQGDMTAMGYCRVAGNSSGWFLWGDAGTDGHAVSVVGQFHWAVKLSSIGVLGAAVTTETQSQEAAVEDEIGRHRSQDPEEIADSVAVSHGEVPSFDMAASQADPQLVTKESASPSLVRRASLLSAPTAESDGASETPLAHANPAVGGAQTRDPSLLVNDDRTSEARQRQSGKRSAGCSGGLGCVAVIDTGSNIIAGPSEAVKEISRSLGVKADCSNLDSLPHLRLQLADGFEAFLPASSYVMKLKAPPWFRLRLGHAHGAGAGAGASPLQHHAPPTRYAGPAATRAPLAQEQAEQGGANQLPFGSFPSASLLDGGEGSEDVGAREAGYGNVSWSHVLATFARTHHIDLAAALADTAAEEDVKNHSALAEVCMPAIVPLDRETKLGSLWVVGTPLFETHYARFSWSLDAAAPSIYFKKAQEAESCKNAAAAAAESGAESSSSWSLGERTQRSFEHREPSLGAGGSLAMELALDEIRFPHWAKRVDEL